MKAFAALAVSCVLASAVLAQSTSTGHFDKKGNWIPPKQSKAKKPKSQEIKIPTVKIPSPPKPKKQSKTTEDFRPGYHREYRFVPGRQRKDGSYAPGEMRWVWVKDPSFKRPKKPKAPKIRF